MDNQNYDKWKLDNGEIYNNEETYEVSFRVEGTEEELQKFEEDLIEIISKYKVKVFR